MRGELNFQNLFAKMIFIKYRMKVLD